MRTLKSSPNMLARVRAWYLRNKDLKKAYDRAYNVLNKEKRRTQKLEWVRANPGRRREITKRSYERRKEVSFCNAAARRARKLRAMPKWLSATMLAELRLIYLYRPDGFHVDHIVPLAGKNVCGLHVPWNLQYLPASENFSKGARYED